MRLQTSQNPAKPQQRSNHPSPALLFSERLVPSNLVIKAPLFLFPAPPLVIRHATLGKVGCAGGPIPSGLAARRHACRRVDRLMSMAAAVVDNLVL